MSDLISRDDAIEAIKKEIEMDNIVLQSSTITYNTREALRQRIGEAREIITLLEVLPSANQWIPCSERLPSEDGDYLVTYEKGYA